jgi:hypothetical protein
MKTRLLLAAAALMAVTAANAAALPKKFLGEWGDGSMQITQRGYVAPGESCRFNSIISAREGFATLIDVTCGFEDEPKPPQRSRVMMDIQVINGKQVLLIVNDTSSRSPWIQVYCKAAPSQVPAPTSVAACDPHDREATK